MTLHRATLAAPGLLPSIAGRSMESHPAQMQAGPAFPQPCLLVCLREASHRLGRVGLKN